MRAEFESFLKDLSDSFLERDLALWRASLILPFSVVTKTGSVTMQTDEEVAENFRHYLEACDRMQLDIVDHVALSLEDCHDGTWLGTFQTRLLSNTILTTDPNTSTVLLHLRHDRFRMSSMMNAHGPSNWTQIFDTSRRRQCIS